MIFVSIFKHFFSSNKKLIFNQILKNLRIWYELNQCTFKKIKEITIDEKKKYALKI